MRLYAEFEGWTHFTCTCQAAGRPRVDSTKVTTRSTTIIDFNNPISRLNFDHDRQFAKRPKCLVDTDVVPWMVDLSV